MNTESLSKPPLTLVMPTISWEESFVTCLRASLAALGPKDEAIVVFDGDPPPPPEWLLQSTVKLLISGQRSGPASARNLAASEARGEILWFVDSDVQPHPDAVDRIRAHFAHNPALTALFGSYDDTPAAPGMVSRFRNLLHHHTHTSHPGPACTFWAGLGAVRRETFLALGGFNAEAYCQPCIEDIEFGLRLHDAGGLILLDPAIQGKHHKCWTLRLMVLTDIINRAIPWSRLLLIRRRLPTTLNLSHSARFSAAASLLIPVALIASALNVWQPWTSLMLAGCLFLILLLNRSFLTLLWRQGGGLLFTSGFGLFVIYLIYSSLSFLAVAVCQLATAPFRAPKWFQARPTLERMLCLAGLVLLALMAAVAIARGVVLLGLADEGKDLYQRFDEWRLFRDQIYPSGHLADAQAQARSYFRTTVYLPWALPLFGPLFAGGGILQGKLIIIALSLAALGLIAAIGWVCLRPLGRRAAWLGLLGPLAIAGNSNGLAHGQFSLVVMGLISLQWTLLARRRPISAGVCWALAMLKPQIAFPFVVPLLTRHNRVGLVVATGLLLALSSVALFHTRTSADQLMDSWIRVLPGFVNVGNFNVLGKLVSWRAEERLPLMGGVAVLLVLIPIAMARIGRRAGKSTSLQVLQRLKSHPLELAGLCGLLGLLSFYHLNYDNIMVFPALLAVWRAQLVDSRRDTFLITFLLSLTSWTPLPLQEAIPAIRTFRVITWSLCSIWLLLTILGDPLPTDLGLEDLNLKGSVTPAKLTAAES
jgi:GT2 family glycosyltransferase